MRRRASRRRTTGASAAPTGSGTSATNAGACASSVGVIDLTPFTKHVVEGPGAEAWLDGLVANKVPTKIGRMALSHALTKRGGIRSEFTITKLGRGALLPRERGRGGALRHATCCTSACRPTARCALNITTSRGCFVVAGPRSRDVLAKLTDTPLDNDAFPWLTGQVAEVGLAPDVYLLRVNFVGSLGWELHFPIEYARHLFVAIFTAGAEHGIGMAGMRAMESLRMEKSYRMWGSDLTRENTPLEASLDRFVRMEKGDFAGKAALERQLADGVPNRFVTLEVHGVTDADPLGNEPLFDGKGRMIGRATSGCYGHVLGKSLAIGYVKPEFAEVGTRVAIEILGERQARRRCWSTRPTIPRTRNSAPEAPILVRAVAAVAEPLAPSRLARAVAQARAEARLRRGHRRRRRPRPRHRLLPRRRARHHATSRCSRRAGSAAATPAATPPSSARTTCSTRASRSTTTR